MKQQTTSRRSFLRTAGSVLALPAAASLVACADQAGDTQQAPSDISTAETFAAPVGLQLYTMRNELGEDLEGTLRSVREAGFTDVETYSFHDMTPSAYRALLDDVGINVRSMHVDYDRVVNETSTVAEEAQTMGSQWVVVPWIPHEEPFSAEDMDRAIADFSTAAQALQDDGLRFAYHVHGYEFHEAEGGGTLFDRLMNETEPGVVDVEMDVFWVVWPGADPVGLIEQYPGRFPLFHLKDMRQDAPAGDLTGHAPLENQVPVGRGKIDMPSIIRAAEAHGVERYFIEYEHTNPLQAAQQSMEYLRTVAV